MSDRDRPQSADGLVVICTRNRPKDLAKALAAIGSTAPALEVLVADASDHDHIGLVNDVVRGHPHTIMLTCRPGLARQRNQALEWVSIERPETPYVHFIDDDTEVLPGYFDAVVTMFLARPEVAGVGGVVLNHPRPRHTRIKALFLLYGRKPGRVLPSGRLTIGHYPGDEAEVPQCLPGCAMSYRWAHIRERRFDDRLEGYSYGEDLYFSFSLHHDYPLTIAREARVLHSFSETNRLSRNRVAADRVALLHRFVRENRRYGLRLSAFWWSVLGDMALKLLDGIAHADLDSIRESGAILRSSWLTFLSPLPASIERAAPKRTDS